jgi:hypothetical protein
MHVKTWLLVAVHHPCKVSERLQVQRDWEPLHCMACFRRLRRTEGMYSYSRTGLQQEQTDCHLREQARAVCGMFVSNAHPVAARVRERQQLTQLLHTSRRLPALSTRVLNSSSLRLRPSASLPLPRRKLLDRLRSSARSLAQAPSSIDGSRIPLIASCLHKWLISHCMHHKWPQTWPVRP